MLNRPIRPGIGSYYSFQSGIISSEVSWPRVSIKNKTNKTKQNKTEVKNEAYNSKSCSGYVHSDYYTKEGMSMDLNIMMKSTSEEIKKKKSLKKAGEYSHVRVTVSNPPAVT